MKNSFFIVPTVLFCLFFALNKGYAQSANTETTRTDVKISLSDEYQDKHKDNTDWRLFKDTTGNIYVLKMESMYIITGMKNYIEKYTPDLKQVFEKEVVNPSPPVKGQDLMYDELITLKGQTFIFGHYYKTNTMFTMKIDSSGSFGTPVKIADFGAGARIEKCAVKLSKDSSKVLLFPLLRFNIRNDTLRSLTFLVLDNDLKPIWEKKTALFSEVKPNIIVALTQERELNDFNVWNNGNVSALYPIPLDKKAKEGDFPAYKLCVFQAKEQEPKEFILDAVKKHIRSCEYLETNNPNKLVVVGTYTETLKTNFFNRELRTTGTFFFTVDMQTGVIDHVSINPFTDRMAQFMHIDTEKEKESVQHLKLINTHISDKNNVTLVLEQRYLTEQHGTAYMPNMTEFHSDIMLSIKYDDNGKIIYQNFIPKRLNSLGGSEGLYFISKTHDDKHIFLYNDHKTNIGKTLITWRDIFVIVPVDKSTTPRATKISETGRENTSELFSAKDQGYILQPNISLEYAPGVIITIGRTRKKFKLVKVTY